MGKVLITGGDGYLGLRVGRCLAQSGQELILSMRKHKVEEKTQKIIDFMGEDLFRAKVQTHFASLEEESPFANLDTGSIQKILHTAAVIRFNVEEDMADLINVEGTRKILEFARSCKNLEQMNYLSTVYASGAVEGVIMETSLNTEIEFTNHYERSKNVAENLLLSTYSDLPWNILRVATVICEDSSGVVHQYNAVHNTLRLLYNGLISLVPGKEETPLYFVTAKFVSEAAASILLSGSRNQIFHICHTREESATLGEVMDRVFGVFENNEEFQRKRILRPIFVDNKSFSKLSDSLGAVSGGIVGEALKSIAPFAEQMYRNKEFDNTNTKHVFPAYAAPDIDGLICSTTEYLVSSKWGRKNV